MVTGLISLNSFSQDHYTINWKTTPVNEVPVAYTTNHHKLNGQVKSVQEINYFDTVYYEFDRSGLLTSYRSKSKTYSTFRQYRYNFPGKMIEVTIDQNGKAENHKIYLNAAGQVIKSIYKSIPAEYEEFEYDDKGLLSKVFYSPERKPVSQFEYNINRQVVKHRHFIYGKPDVLIEPTYLRVNEQLHVLTYLHYETENEKAVESAIYDEAGLPVKLSSAGYTTNYTYQIDTKGNWTSKTSEEKNADTKAIRTLTVTRKISYY